MQRTFSGWSRRYSRRSSQRDLRHERDWPATWKEPEGTWQPLEAETSQQGNGISVPRLQGIEFGQKSSGWAQELILLQRFRQGTQPFTRPRGSLGRDPAGWCCTQLQPAHGPAEYREVCEWASVCARARMRAEISASVGLLSLYSFYSVKAAVHN